ncbi:MAG: acyltransferase [Chloroflexi bacterium]|nr:acyltransferase [Chloroflexota bacterium]
MGSPTTTAARSESRLPALDGIRGLAILMVMEFHFWGLVFGLSGRRPETGIDGWAKRITGVGWSGVDLFFVLSGFLITGILYDAKSSNSFFRSFYARRFLRLAPVYYLFLLFVLLVVPFIHEINVAADVPELRAIQAWMWLYASNIGSAVKPFDARLPLVHAHFWSLAVEEQFYLVWPVVVFLLSRRQLMWACGAMVFGALAIRFVLTEGYGAGTFGLNAPGVLMPARMDALALGALIALAARGTELPLLSRLVIPVATLSAAYLLGTFIMHDGLDTLDNNVRRLGYTCLALLYASLLTAALQARAGSQLHRLLTLPVLRTFGKYSYAMYVVHLLTAVVLARQFLLHDMTPTLFGSQIPLNIIFSATATATTMAIAWLSWQLIEQPLLRLKAFFPYQGRPAHETAGAAPAAVPEPATMPTP